MRNTIVNCASCGKACEDGSLCGGCAEEETKTKDDRISELESALPKIGSIISIFTGNEDEPKEFVIVARRSGDYVVAAPDSDEAKNAIISTRLPVDLMRKLAEKNKAIGFSEEE
jgi:hypothetical protein